MIQYMKMRKELLGYLIEVIRVHDDLILRPMNKADYPAVWARQMFANDFILDDINVVSDKVDWIGAIFYDENERVAVRKVGNALKKIYLVGEAGEYAAAFKSSYWEEAFTSAKAALELMHQNDFSPPN